ncbi:putative transcription factor [Hibiscus syriacus]|uniref:Transcription factor n=1 Tax=Hibiscus syriacus TaxID=106335 RepID=A0A6A3AGX2_HIBSY|nr:putative transcription factor [Hibiscus syriacus]
MWIESVRFSSKIIVLLNLMVLVLGCIVVAVSFPGCNPQKVLPIIVVSLLSIVRIGTMIRLGIAQEATARIITQTPPDAQVLDPVKYKTWLWWSRFSMVLTILQISDAFYLLISVAQYLSKDAYLSTECFIGGFHISCAWKHKVMLLYLIMACCIALAHCFTGSDVLRRRFYYASQDDAWKTHYQEIFDHGIREALCCMGRINYLTVMEDDEVYSVAKLLGELVAYRSSGTGHLELLTGLALIQKLGQSCKTNECSVGAPLEHLQAAVTFHKFAEAAYTGPLLDMGRNSCVFPCVWLYRQGVLSPWSRKRRPALDGDNWWRGHAAAFLKFVNLPPEVLRRGRVRQKACEAAYFVVVLNDLRSVVIAVRGTETPEDLIIDGLGMEHSLTVMDLDGLINSSDIHPSVKQRVESSFPHFGHSETQSGGFLSSLLGAGCECEGYNLRIVGHSLGGSIAALLGIRLHGKFPNLHVYSYGPLPCVDSVVADACSNFITSIIHDSEFSTRLSVGSILRLRAAAITALSENTQTDTTLILRLARQFLYASKTNGNKIKPEPSKCSSETSSVAEVLLKDLSTCAVSEDHNQEASLYHGTDSGQNHVGIGNREMVYPFSEDPNQSYDDPISQFMKTASRSENSSASDPTEMFLPGLLIHILPQPPNLSIPLWKSWGVHDDNQKYKAVIVNQEDLKDIVVAPNMFFDHLPWRCINAKGFGSRKCNRCIG